MEEMTFTKAIATCFRKSFDFSGRARRSEYWYFWLFEILINIPIYFISQGKMTHPLYIIFSIIMFFPQTAAVDEDCMIQENLEFYISFGCCFL